MVILILKLSDLLLGMYGVAAFNYECLCDVLWCFGMLLLDIRIDSSFWHWYRCCHLISTAFLTSYFWRSTMGMWECASVTCCICFYAVICWPPSPSPLVLFIVFLQISHRFFISIFEAFCFIIILFPFLPDWCWFTFVSSRLFRCHFTAAGIWWVSFSVICRVVQSNVSRKQKKASRFVLQSWTFRGRRRSNCLFASASAFASIV